MEIEQNLIGQLPIDPERNRLGEWLIAYWRRLAQADEDEHTPSSGRNDQEIRRLGEAYVIEEMFAFLGCLNKPIAGKLEEITRFYIEALTHSNGNKPLCEGALVACQAMKAFLEANP